MPTAYIALGANLPSHAGPPESTLAAAARRLESLGRITRRSSLYSTEPVGFANQPRFINAVVALETDLAPRQLLNAILAIEQEFGRDRSAGVANGPRTLDLDILMIDDQRISEPGLEVPHPRLAERAFVLVPLNQIAPHVIPSGSGMTVSQLLNNLHQIEENKPNEVVPVENENWRPGSGIDGACHGEP
jgi:2-amino-4-hydroxy-6-hydroxymethyldihydropteridine diphosphokinase